ncbi:MAG: hypothetical protein AAB393_17655, partial [Bacteroidota bacterium]
MDTLWAFTARWLGYNATILPKTALDDTAFFGQTGVLIISSGGIYIPANRAITILRFIRRGKPVYFQNEFSCGYASNVWFDAIVDSLGGTYTPVGTIGGNLTPMTVLGTLSTTPNPIASLAYFWWGCHGTGDTLTFTPFLKYQGNEYGFIFTPPNPAHGKVIMTVDQDWIRDPVASRGLPLIKNILVYLSGATVGVQVESPGTPDVFHLNQNYPNPFNPTTDIRYGLPVQSQVTVAIYNIVGQEVTRLLDGVQSAGYHEVVWD